MKTVATTENSLVTLTPETMVTLAKMDAIAEQGRLAMSKASNSFEKGFLLADAMNQLRAMLTPEMMKPIMTLQGSALGFKGDKDYPVEVVKDCVIEAAMIGLYVCNNEMNIIAGRCYSAKNGLARLVRTFPGLTDLVMTPGIPANREGGTLVPYVATFKINGLEHRIERTIPIRVNSGAIVDATMGKAKRKMYAAILEHVTGSEITEGEAGDEPLPTVTAPAAAKRAPLPTETKPANVTSEKTVPPATEQPKTETAATPPKQEPSSDSITGDPATDAEIKEKDHLMKLIREDQEAAGWSDAEIISVLKGGYGFPKHSPTIKELEDCTVKFLDMVVKALPGLNKAIDANRTP